MDKSLGGAPVSQHCGVECAGIEQGLLRHACRNATRSRTVVFSWPKVVRVKRLFRIARFDLVPPQSWAGSDSRDEDSPTIAVG